MVYTGGWVIEEAAKADDEENLLSSVGNATFSEETLRN